MTIALGILAAVASLAAQAAPAKPAQGAGADPAAVVQARDDAFWRAYNACDTAA